MEIEVKKENFGHLLRWSLNSVGIADELLDKKIDEFHEELRGLKISDEGEYENSLNKKMTDYIFNNYDKVVVSADEKVYGIKEDRKVLLFDGQDSKVYSEAARL